MSKTFLETFNIHKGTYDKIKDHIGENDLGFATDKGLPIPTQDDINKLLVVGPDGNYRLATKQLSRNYVYSTQESFINCIKYEQVDNTYKLTRIKNEQTTLDQDIQYFELAANFYIVEKEVPDYWLASKEITLGEGETFSPLLFFQELETKYEAPIKFFTGIALEGREWVDGELIYCTEDSTNYKKGNYYYYNGTVHKVATDTEVNTKLDKSEFNTFKDNLNSILENIQPSAIVDFDKFTKQGTVVPDSGYLDKIYFNTDASNEEVYAVLDTLTYTTNTDLLSLPFAVVAANDTLSKIIICTKWASVAGQYAYAIFYIESSDGEKLTDIFIHDPEMLNVNPEYPDGWQMSECSLGINNILSTLAPVYNVPIQNDLLESIVSSTPFKDIIPDTSEEVLYRLSKKSDPYMKGTTVPNTGYVEHLYFNTDLSTDEVDALLSKLTYTTVEDSDDTAGTTSYVIIAENIDMNPRDIIVLKESGGYIILQLIPTQIFYVSPGIEGWGATGWNVPTNPFILGYEVKSSTNAGLIGQNNDLLNSLISTTPFVETQDILGYELYMYKNGEYIKVYPQLPIVDVEQLPGSYTGTALKEGSTVVYFNTNAPYEQIYNWVSSQTGWVNTGDYEIIILGIIKIDTNYIPGLLLMRVYAESSYMYTLGAMEYPLWVDEVAAKFLTASSGIVYNKGWNLEIATSTSGVSFTPLNLAPFGASMSITDGTNDYTDTYNSLSWLGSSTEFTLTGAINENVIYRLKTNTISNEYKGNAIPNDNVLIEKIYFNTEMSNEDVYALLSSLTTFKDNDLGDTYIILAAGPNSTTNYQLLSIWGGHVLMLADKSDSSQSKIIWVSPQYIADNNITAMSAGWQGIDNKSMYLFTTDSATVTLQGGSTTTVSVGSENEKLSSLVSWSPFIKVPGEPKYDLYYYKDKYIKLIQEGDSTGDLSLEVNVENTETEPIKLENIKVNGNIYKIDYNDSHNFEIIEITTDSTNNITITQEMYNKISNNDRIIIKINIDKGTDIFDTITLYKANYFQGDNSNHIYVFSNVSITKWSSSRCMLNNLYIKKDLSCIFTNTYVGDTIRNIKATNGKISLNIINGEGMYISEYFPLDISVTENSNNLISSGAVYTALQSYAKTEEVNQMIADYITTNFENGDEGSY